MTPERTPEGKWYLYHATTGQRFVRWPVDASAMLASGMYTAAPSDTGESPAAPVTPEAEPPAPDVPAVPVPLRPRRSRA